MLDLKERNELLSIAKKTVPVLGFKVWCQGKEESSLARLRFKLCKVATVLEPCRCAKQALT
jgi:hypothetical protein